MYVKYCMSNMTIYIYIYIELTRKQTDNKSMRTQTYSAVPVHENLKACPKRARVWMKIRRGYNGSVRLHFKFERSRRFMEENGNTLDVYNSQCMYAWLYVCMYACMYV